MTTPARSAALALTALAACFAPEPGSLVADESSGETSSDSGESSGLATTAGPESSSSASESSADESTGSSSADESTGGSSDDGASTGEPAAPCDVDMPFAAPTLVTELDTESHEDHAWLSHDELTIYVSTNRDDDAVGYDIYTAVRADRGDPFGELTLLTGSASEDRGPTLTADGLTLYVASSPVGALSYDLMVATRADLFSAFSELAPVEVVNSEDSDSAPSISPDGTTLWFDSHRDGSGDIYRTQRSGDEPFAIPTPVGELNTPSEEAAPVPSEDGLTIWFASNRVGGVGDYDVWTATRTTTDDGFGAPTNVPEVSSSDLDWPTWISPDGCRLYIGSRRPDGGDYDLWVAER